MSKQQQIMDELEQVWQQNGGILKAEDVVEFAKDPATALHARFEWSNKKAANEYRLEQARYLIRVSVTVLPNTDQPFRAFVSLMSDRTGPGGGYRLTADVLSNQRMRESLLAQALAELRRIRDTYKQLKELAPVFEAIDAVAAKTKTTTRRTRTAAVAAPAA